MKRLTLTLLVLAFSIGSFAQKEGEKRNKKAEKIAYYTTKLQLTTEEAEKFWPVYNEAEAEHKALRKANKEAKGEKKKISEMSDQEVEALIDQGLEMQQKELDIKKKYHSKFKEILPIKKVAKLIRLEHEYKIMRKGKGDGHRPPHGPLNAPDMPDKPHGPRD